MAEWAITEDEREELWEFLEDDPFDFEVFLK